MEWHPDKHGSGLEESDEMEISFVERFKRDREGNASVMVQKKNEEMKQLQVMKAEAQRRQWEEKEEIEEKKPPPAAAAPNDDTVLMDGQPEVWNKADTTTWANHSFGGVAGPVTKDEDDDDDDDL